MMNTILVTGGAGYIGLHLVLMLEKAGYNVVVLDNLSTGYKHPILKDRLIKGDIGNQALLDTIFKKYSILAIIHLAALIDANDSIHKPIEYYNNNVCQTLTLLEKTIQNNVKNFIFASLAAVFSHTLCQPIDEKQSTNPATPYGKGKRLIECALKDCYTAYGLNSIILRYFNVAGADLSVNLLNKQKQWTQLIPKILKTAKGEYQNIEVYGDQHDTPDDSCVRDYIHVNDICAAHIKALKKISQIDGCFTYHLGSSKGTSVKEALKAAEEITRRPTKRIISPARTADSSCVIANNQLAKDNLDWVPKHSDISTIIKSFWRWFK